MTDIRKPRITRLPPNGPKPGQSLESWLRGKAQGDKRWQRVKDRNIARLLQRRPPSTTPSP